jgi:hypothetical protein
VSGCEAKRPFEVPGLPGVMWRVCGEPSTAVYDYWCACGRHSRRGETCEAHRPIPGEVGCSRCWGLAGNGHECAMSFAEVTEAPPVVVEAAGGLDVCDLCGFPAVERDGRWVHELAADEVFCALLFPRSRGVGSGGSE